MTTGAQYQIGLYRDDGTRLIILSDWSVAFEYTRVLNDAGFFAITLPKSFDARLIDIDRRVIVWRKTKEGATPSIDFAGFVRGHRRTVDESGNIRRVIYGPDYNGLLASRIVAYTAGHARASVTDNSDDIMKLIVAYNLGASATTGNGRLKTNAFSSTYFSTAADVSLGPSLSKGFAYRNCLDVLKELAGASRLAGTEVYFDIVPTGETTMEFRTYVGQLGKDRTAVRPNGLVFGLPWGNLAAPELDEDWSGEANIAYGLGQGDGASRTTQISEDTARSGASIWSAREVAADARNETSTAAVLDAADAAVMERRPVRSFSGELLSVPGSVYGLDWGFGDRVTVSFDGLQFDALVRAVSILVDEMGQETVRAVVEAYL